MDTSYVRIEWDSHRTLSLGVRKTTYYLKELTFSPLYQPVHDNENYQVDMEVLGQRPNGWLEQQNKVYLWL